MRATRKRPRLRARPGVMIVKGNVGDSTTAPGRSRRSRRSSVRSTCWSQRRHHPRRHAAQDDPQQWNEVIFVNLASIFNMSRQVIDGMRARGYGRIINISSINGQRARWARQLFRRKAGVIGSPKPWRRRPANKGSRSTPWRPAISTPRWSRRCRPTSWSASWRHSRRTAGQGRGDRRLRGLPGAGGRLLHYWGR